MNNFFYKSTEQPMIQNQSMILLYNTHLDLRLDLLHNEVSKALKREVSESEEEEQETWTMTTTMCCHPPPEKPSFLSLSDSFSSHSLFLADLATSASTDLKHFYKQEHTSNQNQIFRLKTH